MSLKDFYILVKKYEIYEKNHGFIIEKEELLKDLYYLLGLNNTLKDFYINEGMINYLGIQKLLYLIKNNYIIKKHDLDLSDLLDSLEEMY